MPEVDGVELARQLRLRPETRSVPLIMLSSIGRSEARLNDLPLFAYLTKPLKPQQLHNTLVSLFSGLPGEGAASQPVTPFDATLGVRHPLRILLAEDNLVNPKVALKILERLGYRADVANNGLQVLSALEQNAYDLVLMDIQMPEMDGVAATDAIVRRYGAHRPRIVALTAHALEGDREFYLSAGMDDYLSKPVQVEALVAVLEQTDSADHAPIIDRAFLTEQFGAEADSMLAEILPVFKEETTELLQGLSRAVAAGDAESGWQAAHSIKGAAGSLGMQRLRDLAAALEQTLRQGNLAPAPDLLAQMEQEFQRL